MRLNSTLVAAATGLAFACTLSVSALELPDESPFPDKLKLRGVFVRGAGELGPASGSLQIKFKKGKQQVDVKAKGLAGPADFDVFLQNSPGNLFYTRVTVMEIDEKGRGQFTFESDGEPLRAFLGATLDELEGMRLELRDPGNNVILSTVFQALEKPEKSKLTVTGDLAPASAVPLRKAVLKTAFSSKKGTLKMSVSSKAPKGADLRLEIEDATGAFVEVATLVKGKTKLDTKKGDSLGDVLTGADLDGRQVRITSGGDVVATFDL